MIRGRFGDTSGQPYVEGRLLIKQLKICEFISFCIDTGSDETVLLPADSSKMPLDFSKFKKKTTSCTLNGACELYSIPATLQFVETDRRIFSYDITLKIATIDPILMELPSIVGRNIIDRWSINYCKSKNRLNIKVIDAVRVNEIILTP